MEEEDKGGTWKPVEKASLLPATKPRPAPRKRSHQPKPDITIENGKPENIPPKPAVHPKPRRPPPKAPNVKTPETAGKGVILINNNNLSADKEPLAKQGLVNKAIKNNEIRVPKIESSVKSVTECNDTSNGPVNDSVDDQQWYEPLRPTVSGSSSSSDEGYEAISVPRASKITPPSPCKTSGVAGNSNQVSLSSKESGTEPHKAITTTSRASPPTSHKISGTGPKFSPPVPRKVISQGSKFSPPTPRKPIGVASKTSPPVTRKISGLKVETTPPSFRKASDTRQPEAVKDLSPNTSPRTLYPSTASNKSKPLPPKKPLPSLPKDLASAGQTTTTEANKPSVPQKPPPDLSSSSKGESSVAALAQKLSTIPVFPFRDNGSSPRPSPHPSPRPSRSQASNSPGDKSDNKPALGSVKPAEPAKPKLLPKPGVLPVKPQAGNEVQKHLLGRPSAPSAEVVARARSKTVESLEDNDSDTPSETSVVGTETQKKRLATQRKPLHPIVNRSSSNGVQASRRPPPLPPGATPVTEIATVLKGPPLPPVPRPRPVSAYDHTQGGGVKLSVSKSVSMSAISNVSLAEDQSQYSYAYEHAFIGTSPPMSGASSAHSPTKAPTDEAGGAYETPDENVVNEFMEDIQEKRAATAAYETADEQAVAGFVSSLKRKHTLNGLQCDLSTDESDFSDSDHDYTEPPTDEKDEEDGDDHNDASSEHSFSSDSSHDYCVPPESISPPEPPNNYGDVYDEVDDLYAEPIHKSDGEGFSSDEERDTFAEEPLYQVYTRCTLQRQRSISRQRMGSDSSDKSLTDDEAFLEQLEKGTLRNMRVLWCELPEVKESGILDNIKREERKRQEAMFEVITSEASYLRSLNILMSQFIKSEELNAGSSLCVLERGQSHVLFSNINSIKSVSENFLQALRARQKEAVLISSISDIIEQHVTQCFEVYVKYFSNQIYQDRALRNLSVVITGGTSVKTVSVGKNLTLECIANGTPQPEIQWTRVDGLLPEVLISKGGQLIFPRARLAYGGVYRCKVTNSAGSVQSEVAIFVQETPKVMVTPQKSRVKTGETVQFTCIASSSTSPDLTWRKVNGSLPVSSTVQRGVLKIANVTQKDAGSYNCEAKNVEGSANRSGILEIKVTVPRLTQEPLSYLSVQTLTDEPLNFTVEIVFIPEMADGPILYNDQLTNGSVGDFISFGMSDRFAEFRFNLGFEPAIIRSRQPLSLYEWHRVVLSRTRKEGNLTVDGEPPVTGVCKGSSTGLNLNQDLHVGGVLEFSSISSLAGFKSGFIGCLSYLAIDGKVVSLGDLIKSVGLDDCEVCQTRPCKNGGTCTEVAGDRGFIFTCRPGFSGRTCDDAGNKCSPGVCNEGRCENIGNDGFRCNCPAGYSGERCEEGRPIDTPMFEGDSYMSLPGIEGAALQLRFSIRFLALKSGNMLLLYNGQTIFPGRGDFISLAINGGRVEFRFNMGSGTGILRSARNISVGFWHTVIIERQLRDSLLVLDDDPPVKGSSPCCSRGLNLLLDLFIGGVKNFTTFHTSKVGVSSGLFGCISELSVDGREINLLKSNLDMRGIKQCTECLLPCELKRCLNNATCIPVENTGFFCSCAPGYTGQKCEFTLADPLKSNTCVNGGVELSSSDRLCSCPLGYGGRRCNKTVQFGKNALFSGDGFLEFPSSSMRGPRSTTPDYMSLEIKTEAQNGVILWQGERRDHFAIGLRDGFLEFRFELGSGPAVVQSLSPVNDSQWHSIKVYRSFSEGSLKVDNHDHVNGTSAEGSKGLNINQGHSIFIGGGENIAKMTHGKFNTGFRGCIKNTFFKDRGMDLQGDAIRGWNVLPCDSDEAEP